MLLDVLIPYYGNTDVVIGMVRTIFSTKLSKQHIRVVLIDNCSDMIIDDDFIKEYSGNIKYIRNPYNIGRIGNWNEALNHVESTWYCFLFLGDKLLNVDDLINKLLSISDSSIVTTRMSMKFPHANKIIGKYIFDKDGFHSGNYLIKKYLSLGLMPWGPLQSNFFSKKLANNIKFETNDEYYSDVKYIIHNMKDIDVSILSSVHLEWLVDLSRTHFKKSMSEYMINDYLFISQYLNLNLFRKINLKLFLSLRSLIMIRHYGVKSSFDAIIKIFSR